MKYGILTVVTAALIAMPWAGRAESPDPDFSKAMAAASQKNLPILVMFTGSDWCGWCQKLEREILDKSEFKEYAEKSLVVFSADFPMKKALPDATTKQNKKLAEQYSVEGFPTVVLLNKDGKEIGRTGYRAGGPEAYVKHLKELLSAAKI